MLTTHTISALYRYGRWLGYACEDVEKHLIKLCSQKDGRDTVSLIIALRRSLLQYCQNADPPDGDETLRQSISRLRAHDREVIALAYLFQLPFCDIAMICSQPEDSTRQRLCMIRQHLQTTLSDKILSPSGID